MPFRASDVKQWAYCPRLLYYALCLPDIRPITFMMEVGREAGRKEALRELRRSLRRYGLPQGRCEFEVDLFSTRLGVRGKVDMVIYVEEGSKPEVIAVDYKYSSKAAVHFQLQLVVYGLLLEEYVTLPVQRGFLYEIPLRKPQEVVFTRSLREKALRTLQAMRLMLESEQMPSPTSQRGKCVVCEFRRFCNDVV